MGLLEKQFDIWKLERMWKMEEPQVCGFCGIKRGECPICPNTADNKHVWDAEPWASNEK